MGGSPELDPRGVAVAASWLLAFALHSTVLLGSCWLLLRALRPLREGVQECLWKFATVAGLCTASLQQFLAVSPQAAAAPGPGSPALAPAPLAFPPLLTLGEPRVLPAFTAGRLDLPVAIVLVAGALALLALAFLLRDRLALQALLRGRAPVTDQRLQALLAGLLRDAGLRGTVRLTVCAGLRSPIAFGIRTPEICVPPEVDQLDRSQQRSMLAHELAHLLHRDPLWLAALSVLAGLFPWQPLLRVARRQLRELAELRCDAWAAQRTGGIAMAQCLVQVAGWVETAPLLGVAGMASSPTALRSRVDRLLAGRPVRGPGRHRLWLWPLLLVSTLALATAVPAAAFDRARPIAVAALPGSSTAPSRQAALDQELRAVAADVAQLRQELATVELDHELAALVRRLELALGRLEQHRRRLPVSDQPAAPDAAGLATTSRKDR